MREVLTSPSGATLLDFGQNLVGRLRITRLGRGRPRDRRCATPRCSSTASSASGRCGCADATDRYVLAGDGVEIWEPAFTFHGFRYVAGRRLAGRARPGRRRRRRGPQRHGAHRVVRAAPTRCSTASTRTWCGACGATSSTCPPTARSATSGSAGPATSRSSRRPRPTCSTPTASSPPGCVTSRSSRAAAGGVPFVVPDVLALGGDAGGGVGRRRDGRAVACCTSASATSACSRRSSTACAAGSTRCSRIAGERHLWEGRFQFGDWLDPDAPPDRPADAKTDADLVASAYLFRSTRPRSREAAAVLGPRRARRPVRGRGGGRAARVARRVRHAGGPHHLRRADRLRAGHHVRHRDRPDPSRADGRPARRARAARRLPHRDRVRRHAARRGRADPHGARRRGVAAAAPDREPVVALPGDDGRHDDLGALGQHARGRHHQPRRDDVVQPLRARRDRRLAAPRRRRARARGTRATAGSGSRRSRCAGSTTRDRARDAVRACPRRLVGGRGEITRHGDGPAEHARRGRPPGTLRDVRGGFGAAPLDGRRHPRRATAPSS